MEHEEDFSLQGQKTRGELRALVVSKFLEEAPGEGKGNLTSKYRYNVEQLADGHRIYLTRPAIFKKGFDFLLHVEGARFQNGRENPTHRDITDDLREKCKSLSAREVQSLRQYCLAVYEGHDPDDVLSSRQLPANMRGFSLEVVLKVLKWLWIEQDIRYWNYSGRQMLKASVDKALGGS